MSRRHVAFDEKITVREHELTSGASGDHRTTLKWECAREYDSELKRLAYTPPSAELAAGLREAAAGAQPSMGAGAGVGGSAYPQTYPNVASSSSSSSAALSAPSAPLHVFSPPAAPRLLSPTSRPPPVAPARVREGWHVKRDGCIYQGPQEHSSPIATVQGTLVTTRSGNRYVLGALDAAVREVLELVAPGLFRAEDPLAPHAHAPLLYAEGLVFGAAAAHVRAVREALRGLEGAVGGAVGEGLVAGRFAEARRALAGLGARV